MAFTDEQLQKLMSMPNLTEEERALLSMQSYANQMRKFGMEKRGVDAGSNIARALGHVGGAMGDKRAGEMGVAAGESRRKILSDLFPAKTPVVQGGPLEQDPMKVQQQQAQMLRNGLGMPEEDPLLPYGSM